MSFAGVTETTLTVVTTDLLTVDFQLFLQPWSRLADASYAGYDGNRSWRPVYKNVCNAKLLGAKGDGRTDDTRALQATINCAASRKGAGYLPAGTYVVTKPLFITTSNTVLRGAGKDKTYIYIPKSLEEVYGRNVKIDPVTGNYKSTYSFNGGFIQIVNGQKKYVFSPVTKPARRGQYRLYLKTGHGIKTGWYIRLVMSDPTYAYKGTLVSYLYSGKPGENSLGGSQDIVNFPARVKKVGANWIELERPLGFDVRPGWSPLVENLATKVVNSGLEDFTIKFKWSEFLCLCFAASVLPY